MKLIHDQVLLQQQVINHYVLNHNEEKMEEMLMIELNNLLKK